MREWLDKYNPFNSDKVLIYREWLEGAAVGNFKAPVTVAIDPAGRCNLNCLWCNARRCISGKNELLPAEHYVKIARFCKDWGVISNCIAGGGEPFCNPDATVALLNECHDLNISNSVITNGTLIDDIEILDVLARTCRWVGFSVDAGTAETYAKLKGCKPDLYNQVLENMGRLRKLIDKLRTKCEIGFKFVLHPDNAHEILEACNVAKENGAHDFQLRPFAVANNATTDDQDRMVKQEPEINRQIDACLDHTTRQFRVYAIRHKFNRDYKPKFFFRKCRASALHPVFMANGDFGLCIDRRGDDRLTLCRHYPDLDEVKNAWNGKKHKALLDAVSFKDCPKCTFSKYNEIIEKVFIGDGMCRRHV